MKIKRTIEGKEYEIELTNEELQEAYFFEEKKRDAKFLAERLKTMADFKEIPEMDEATMKKVSEAACDEYQNCLYGSHDLLELTASIGEDVVQNYLHLLPVKGAYGLCNTASVNIYDANSEFVFAGINDTPPEWYRIEYTDNDPEHDVPFFHMGGNMIYLDDVMRL